MDTGHEGSFFGKWPQLRDLPLKFEHLFWGYSVLGSLSLKKKRLTVGLEKQKLGVLSYQ